MQMIVCCDLEGGIGYNNKLLAHIPEELKVFKNYTKGKAVVMGVNTWNSLPAYLKDRENIVLTDKTKEISALKGRLPDKVITSLEDIPKDSIIIGGASLYAQLISEVETVVVSLIDKYFDSKDVYFPLEKLQSGFKKYTLHDNIYDEKSNLNFSTYIYKKY